MAVAGTVGCSSVPSAMHALLISATSDASIMSDGATGPVENELMADCMLPMR